MSNQWILFGPLMLSSLSMSLTPGPNNVMLTASGAIYGLRRTLPHLLGILGGCFLLFGSIALGLGVLFERFPLLQSTLRWVGSAYLLYLAWKIATAPPPTLKEGQRGAPLTFWQAALFQFANPKAWIMGMALTAGFLPDISHPVVNAVALASAAELASLPCGVLWAGFGMAIGRFIKSDGAWRIFNITMGLLTAACVVMILR